MQECNERMTFRLTSPLYSGEFSGLMILAIVVSGFSPLRRFAERATTPEGSRLALLVVPGFLPLKRLPDGLDLLIVGMLDPLVEVEGVVDFRETGIFSTCSKPEVVTRFSACA